ncbi:hypothetical protein Ae201684_009657 [Aphanomyces euteiches]|uniref:Uncharacterized protein n=2 Tax=Aphanomyces euteiches TaxID=100861 RepID=A0A6G0X0T3_9STRA|nr:hypothetical protein Ae201684_009657 [Aphanomyces euteiches]
MTPFVKRATEDLQRLNVGIIQFAADQDAENWTLLRQGLLDDPDWAYFGWLMIYDWVEGQREVLSFEGDATTMRLISSADSPSQYPSNFDSLTSATRLIYYSVLYTSLILSAIVVASVVYVLCSRFKANGWNLFWFNRIVSSVWIGRPLMFVRGATAALLLSTTQLQTTASPYARFIVPWYEISVLAGEATWILYVAHDLLSVVISRQYAASYCASGCMLAWSALILLEFMWPVMATSSISHDCSAVNLNFGIVCSSGVLRLGSLARVWLIFMIQVTALIFTLLAVGVKHYSNTMRRNMSSGLDLYALGIADHFIFAKRQKRSSFHDYVTCLMAGFVQMRWGSKVYIFDVKLWVILVQDLTHTTTIESILSRRGSVTASTVVQNLILVQEYLKIKSVAIVCGIAYAGVAIFCSVSYLSLSSVNMANDLYWANFNISGAHAFIANWLNMQLVLGITNQTLTLNMAQINLHGSFSSAVDSTVVKAPFKHGALIQHSELNSNITSIIQGLRLTDPCLAPWIFTAYCFVDFDQIWEMADSAARQTRCQKMLSNGAIYLESVLRNIDFERFYNCWGSAFDVAISNELKQSNMGRDWLSSIPLVVDSPISNEVILWLGHNITTFDIQLQNFKSVGFVNTYAIENAYGISYPFTLQSQRYGFRFQKQTSLKMYWGLASDFTAVIQNNSGIVGCSLVRSSSMYAVANTTIQSALQINGTLSSPLVNSYVVFAENIGPFGSIDMRFQACPKEAKQAVLAILQALRLTLAKNVTSQIAFSQLPDPTQIFVVAPKAWQDRSFITMGGNPLCPTASLSSSQSASNGLLALLSWTADCTTTIPMANMIPDRETVIVSAILTNLTDPSGVSIETICQQDAWYKLPCLTLLNQTVAFLQTFMNSNLDSLIKLSSPASSATQRTRVQLFQFGQDNADASLEMHLLDILDPSQPEFTFFSWIYVVDWALGLREAVIIEGDFASMTVLTEYLNPIKQPVNTAETPLILALYMRSTVLYITGVMVGLAGAMLYYILLSRGHIEVLNLMELQRVGAVVWAGRPVLFIRSLTAIALMSTATLQLQYTGYITYFDVGQSSWYNILLAANEVTWMVAVVNDIGLAITRQYTAYYATINSILIWSVTALLSGLVPAQHSLTISKQCHPEQADFEIICTSGIVVIGHKSRLLILVVILLGCNAMCYLATRLWFRGRSRLMNEIRSPYVYAGARYLFTTSNWVWNDIYYMDRMSALLNGILTVRLGTVMHCLDIKQWRTFAVELVPISNIPQSHPLVEPSNFALPLSMKATKQ